MENKTGETNHRSVALALKMGYIVSRAREWLWAATKQGLQSEPPTVVRREKEAHNKMIRPGSYNSNLGHPIAKQQVQVVKHCR